MLLRCDPDSEWLCCCLQGRNLKDVVDTYWTEDATFKTPMFTVVGKTDV